MSSPITDFVDLTAEQRLILEAFEQEESVCQTFYFTGGTLLKALGIVPRVSNDLDFFTFLEINERGFLEQRQKLRTLLTTVFGDQTTHETEHGFVHRPSGMVIDIIRDAIKNIEPFVAFGNLKTAGLKDSGANKASALCSRDELKDYIDIAFLTKKQGWLLKDLEELAEQKFGLGTITEEKLLSELIAKQKQFIIPPDIFLREPEANKTIVDEQISLLIEKTTL
jgi:hypothetical protein